MHKEAKWILYAVLLWALGVLIFLEKAHAAGFYLSEVGSPASLGTGGVANPTNTFGADAAWSNRAGRKAFGPLDEEIDKHLYENTVAENDWKQRGANK